MQYALVNIQDEIIRQQAFTDSPPAPNLVKGLAWLAFIETWPTLTASQKLGGVVVTVDRIARTATKEHLAVDKTAEELATEVAIRLREIDLKSIRSIREYVSAKEDAPKYLRDFEAEAVVARERLA
jgi:hypothetical protein